MNMEQGLRSFSYCQALFFQYLTNAAKHLESISKICPTVEETVFQYLRNICYFEPKDIDQTAEFLLERFGGAKLLSDDQVEKLREFYRDDISLIEEIEKGRLFAAEECSEATLEIAQRDKILTVGEVCSRICQRAESGDLQVVNRFKEVIGQANHLGGVSPETKSSLVDSLESTFEIYEDPISYLGFSALQPFEAGLEISKNSKFRALILNKIAEIARYLIELGPEEKIRFIEERSSERGQARKRKREFQSDEARARQKSRGLPTTTNLTEWEMHLKNELNNYVIERDLVKLRDLSKEVYEDQRVLLQLWRADRAIFQNFAALVFQCPSGIDFAMQLGESPQIWAPFARQTDTAGVLSRHRQLGVCAHARLIPTDYTGMSREIVRGILEERPLDLLYLNDDIRADRESVLAAVGKDGRALQYAGAAMRGDDELVIAAIENNGRALGFVGDKYRDYPEIVFRALKTDPFALMYASERLRENVELITYALEREPAVAVILDRDRIRTTLEKCMSKAGLQSLDRLKTQFPFPLAAHRVAGDPWPWRARVGEIYQTYQTNPDVFRQNAAFLKNDIGCVWLACRLGVDPKIWQGHIDDDEAKLLVVVRENPHSSELFQFKNLLNHELILELMKIDIDYLKCAFRDRFAGRSFVNSLIRVDGRAIRYIANCKSWLCNLPETFLLALETYPEALAFAETKHLRDKGFAIEAIRRNPRSLFYLSEHICRDCYCLIEAVKSDPAAIKLASCELLVDRKKLLAIAKSNPRVLEHLGEEHCADADFIETLMNLNVWDASRLCHQPVDQTAQLAAFDHHIDAFKLMSFSLRKEAKVISKFAKGFVQIFRHSDPEFRQSAELVHRALLSGMEIVELVRENFSCSLPFFEKIAAICVSAFAFAGENLRGSRDFVLKAIEIRSEFLKCASEELRSDESLVSGFADGKDCGILKFASEKLRNDPSFMLGQIEKNNEAFYYASDELRSDRDFILRAAKCNPQVLHMLSEEFRADLEIALAAVRS